MPLKIMDFLFVTLFFKRLSLLMSLTPPFVVENIVEKILLHSVDVGKNPVYLGRL